MGLGINNYIGAYLEIKTKEIEYTKIIKSCENGHKGRGQFCNDCGKPIIEREEKELRHPSHYVDIVGDQWIDKLSVVTPDTEEFSNIIICIGNRFTDGMVKISEHEGVTPLPAEEETRQLINDFCNKYKGLLDALHESKYVVSMEITYGYIVYYS